jgi:hypothetical protein
VIKLISIYVLLVEGSNDLLLSLSQLSRAATATSSAPRVVADEQNAIDRRLRRRRVAVHRRRSRSRQLACMAPQAGVYVAASQLRTYELVKAVHVAAQQCPVPWAPGQTHCHPFRRTPVCMYVRTCCYPLRTLLLCCIYIRTASRCAC